MNVSSTILYPNIKKKVSEDYCWFFLLIALSAPLLITDEKLATNIYRVFICIPVLFCIRYKDLSLYIQSYFFKLFLALAAWSFTSLLWSEYGTIHNMVGKILATLVITLLIFNTANYHPKSFASLDIFFIAISLLLLSHLFLKLDYFTYSFTEVNLGIISNKNEFSWISASATILSLSRALITKNLTKKITFCIIFTVLLVITFALESRGALLGAFFGIIGIIAKYQIDKKNYRSFLFIGISIITIITLSSLFSPGYFSDLIERADSHRFDIYLQAYDRITDSPFSLFFGYGIASSSRLTLDGIGLINNYHSIYINTAFYTGVIGLNFSITNFNLSNLQNFVKEQSSKLLGFCRHRDADHICF